MNLKKLIAGILFELGKRIWRTMPYEILWTPSGLTYVLVPLAYRMAFELPTLTDIPLAALRSTDRALRFQTIETTVSVFEHSALIADAAGSFASGAGADQNPALDVVDRLRKQIAHDTRSARWILPLTASHFLCASLRLPFRYSLAAGYETLFHLCLRIGGVYFDRTDVATTPVDVRERIPEVLTEGARSLVSALVGRYGSDQATRVTWLLALVIARFYSANSEYPCNSREIILALRTAELRARVLEIGELFRLEGSHFSLKKDVFERLSGTPNGYVAWCTATLLSIFGNDDAVHEVVVDWIESARPAERSSHVRLYVLQRAVTYLLLFSTTSRRTSARRKRLVSLFESLSLELLKSGTRIDFSESPTERSNGKRQYLNEALLFYGDYLCRRGRHEEFTELFIDELRRRPDHPRHLVDMITTLGHIGRTSRFVPKVLEVVDHAAEHLRIEPGRSKKRVRKAVVRALAGMVRFNAIAVERHVRDKMPELEKSIKVQGKRLGPEVPSSANYFGDAMYQNILLAPAAREAFAQSTLAAAAETRLVRFFRLVPLRFFRLVPLRFFRLVPFFKAYCEAVIQPFVDASNVEAKR